MLARIPAVQETAVGQERAPGHCHLVIDGVESEALLLLLDDYGVAASAGSACASGAMEPSHVLIAMGYPPSQALGALRLTLGHTSSEADVAMALHAVPAAVARLRRGGAGNPAAELRLPGYAGAAIGAGGPGGTGRAVATGGARLWPRSGREGRGSGSSRGPAVRALVAMSGGVDSSVAAALLLGQGHEVVGATMKLWGGPSDSGCCSVADVEDARRVCQQLGIAHHVFNFTYEFERDVVAPYVSAHAQARTPNPCISCNAHLKFDRFLERARLLGFDAIATGHHARVSHEGGAWQLRRGCDSAKDQSYVLYMLGQAQLAELRLPIGELTKPQVRQLAAQTGLRTATKPDSQDVCFISKTGGRESFLGARIPVSPGRLVATTGEDLGASTPWNW